MPIKSLDPKTRASLDIERAVLGSILLDHDNAVRSFAALSGEEFFLDSHKTIFRTMQGIVGAGREVDLPLLVEELEKQQNLSRAGGAPYVSSLTDGIPRKSNIEHYAGIVTENYRARQLTNFCSKIQERIEAKESVNDLLEESIQGLLEISSDNNGGPLVRKWYDVAQSAIKGLEEQRNDPGKRTRIECGLMELDEVTGGLRKKDLVVIVGPTSNGKTLLAQQYAIFSSEKGYRGIIFSAEMTGEQLVLREVGPKAGIPMWKIRKPEHLRDDDMELLSFAAAEIRANLVIVENDISPMNIWAISEAAKRANGLDFVIVDYDQLVIEIGIDPDDENSFFRHQRKFITQAKKIARRLDICFILLSQLRKVSSRLRGDAKPTIDDIYGDSAIRNTPDLILWVVRDFFTHDFKKEFENKATVYIVKARNDRVGTVKLGFDPIYIRLKDPDPTEKDSTRE
jgi:replicative DNA helicase